MDLAHLKNIRLLLIFTAIFLINCNHKGNQWNKIDQWDEIKIDPQISIDSIYRQLDEQAEIFSMLEEQDSLMKRTSDVEYFGREKLYKDYSKLNNCRAFFFKLSRPEKS